MTRAGIPAAGPAAIARSRLTIVASSSWRLREDAAEDLIAGWPGVIRRPAPGQATDLPALLLTIDTPSMFEPPALHLVRATAEDIQRVADQLTILAGAEVPDLSGAEPSASVLVIITDRLHAGGQRSSAKPGAKPRARKGKGSEDDVRALEVALLERGCLHVVPVPDRKELIPWLVHYLSRQGATVIHAGEVAEVIVRHRGEAIDILATSADLIATAAGDEPITADLAVACLAGAAERPMWELAGAVLKGDVRRSLALLAAGGGADPEMAVNALSAELRKVLACQESDDDSEARRLAGLSGGGSMYYPRQTARTMGRATAARLLRHLVEARRRMRGGGQGGDPERLLELVVLGYCRQLGPGRSRG